MRHRSLTALVLAVLCCLAPSMLWAAAPHVAIVAAATNSSIKSERFTDLRDVLVADGRFQSVDIISTTRFGTGTPTLNALLQYDAIIHWSNDSNDDAVALGNVFADYVDAGGGMVQAVFANTSSNSDRFLQGRWLTDGYNIIPPNGGFTQGPTVSGFDTETAVMSPPLEPDHPIFDNVGEVRLSTGQFSSGALWGAYRPTTTALEPGARKLALWEDGKTAVAISDNFPHRIDLGFHPVSDNVVDGYYDITSDTKRLIANALLHAADITISGDFDGDGDYDCDDINLLSHAASGSGDLAFDLNGDGTVDTADRDAWLAEAGAANLASGNPYLLFDLDLDGVSDGTDFVIWNSNKFTANANYCSGDTNLDGFVDGLDFLDFNRNKFMSADHVSSSVPEPSACLGLIAAVGLWLLGGGRRCLS
ncbi:MAG: hypothetical protein AAGF97_15680 [Planctomycetota bacterium]